MRSIMLILVLSLSAASALAADGESPREFVRRFYAAYMTWEIRGVPQPKHNKLISPFLGVEVLDVFRRVNEQRDLHEKLFPFDPANVVKPPWCPEGDVFCNMWEGVTHYSVGKASRVRGRVVVEAHLEYVEGAKSYPWTDRIVLDRAGRDWVIADILHEGKESMVKSLDDQLKENAKYLEAEAARQKR